MLEKCRTSKVIKNIKTKVSSELKSLDEGIRSIDDINDECKIILSYWGDFYDLSINLLDMIKDPKNYHQAMMTFRLLQEISSDLNFISLNPNNIKKINKKKGEIDKKIKNKDLEYTIGEAAKDMSSLRLFDQYGNMASTGDRINIAAGYIEGIETGGYREYTGVYNYFNAYTHCNYIAIADLEARSDIDKQVMCMDMLKSYTLFLRIINAIGRILNDEKCNNYDSYDLYLYIKDQIGMLKIKNSKVKN